MAISENMNFTSELRCGKTTPISVLRSFARQQADGKLKMLIKFLSMYLSTIENCFRDSMEKFSAPTILKFLQGLLPIEFLFTLFSCLSTVSGFSSSWFLPVSVLASTSGRVISSLRSSNTDTSISGTEEDEICVGFLDGLLKCLKTTQNYGVYEKNSHRSHKFQKEFMKSSFLRKYESAIVRISALQNIFWEKR